MATGRMFTRNDGVTVIIADPQWENAASDSDAGEVVTVTAENWTSEQKIPKSLIESCGMETLRKMNITSIDQNRTNKGGKLAKYSGPVKSRTINAGRNSPCPCGSGKKFKNCHLKQINERIESGASNAN